MNHICVRDFFIWSPPWNSARDLVVHQVSAVGNEEPSIQETLVPWVACRAKIGSFPIKNEDLTIENCDLSIKNDDGTIKSWDLAIKKCRESLAI